MDQQLSSALANMFVNDRRTSSSASGSSSRRDVPSSSQRTDFESMGQTIVSDVKGEMKARKKRRRDHKTTCAQCGKKAETGVKLLMCSRCKAVNYCSPACQKTHYRDGGHKQDCLKFVDPPFSKLFDPSERDDVPWPIDPIFGAAHAMGVGMWVTTNAGLGSGLQQAFHMPNEHAVPDPQGPPSYRRWAGVEGPKRRTFNKEMKKYIGSTLLGLRVIIHNRRTDGRVVGLYLDSQALLAHPMFEKHMLPEQIEKLTRTKLGRDDVLLVEPWIDYNSQSRFEILEINGHTAPVGDYGLDKKGEYRPPTEPTGAPWDRVLSWKKGWLVLGAGDYAVISYQFRMGDGNECDTYPEVMARTMGMQLRAVLLDTKSTEAGWPANANFEWNDPQTMMARMRNPTERGIGTVVLWDYKYLDDYYKPYFEHNSDVFAEQRLGTRAKHVNEMMREQGPKLIQMLLGTLEGLPADKRAEVEQRLTGLGYSADSLRDALGTMPKAA